MSVESDHLERLESALFNSFSVDTIAEFITTHTFLGGVPFSFHEHEIQEHIARDTAIESNVQKCAQVGVSELSARIALAYVDVMSPFTVAYTLPTQGFAGTFTRTRIDPIISGSSRLKAAIHRTTDNNEVKRFGDSYLYIRGAASSNAPISIPVDMLIHDEFDFCDPTVLTQYQSRLRHSKHKRVRRFSTPTLPDYGINKEFKASKRYYNLCKCDHCNHTFIPSFEQHVKVPGFSGDIMSLVKRDLNRIKWQLAQLICPKCGKVPDLGPEHRVYVCENPDDNFISSGHQVSPFDFPTIMTAASLVKESTAYDRKQDFINFGLGLPAEDKEATLSPEDFNHLRIGGLPSAGVYVMGIDVGAVYHIVVGRVHYDDTIIVVHAEKVNMGKFRDRYRALRKEYSVACTVIDSAPHGETVLAMQGEDPNLYASVYVASNGFSTHEVVHKDQDKDEGREFQRQVNVKRNIAFDVYMHELRAGNIKFIVKDDEVWGEVVAHHCSMKRVRTYDDTTGDLRYSWVKTDGEDHYHHAMGYLRIAARIRGLGELPSRLPVGKAHSFRLKNTP